MVSLTARSYRDYHRFSLWEWYFIDILNLSSHISFFLIHGRHLPAHGSEVIFRPCAAAVNNHDIGQSHPRAATYEISQPMVDIYRAVSKVIFRPRPTWTTMRPGNPIWELLYEFRLHCHLMGNLSIRTPSFWQEWFQISRNSKHYIVSIIATIAFEKQLIP